MFDKLSEDQRQALNIVREGHNLFMTGQGGTARQNSCLLSSIFPVGEGGFGQMMYRSLERSPQDPRDGIFFVQCPGLMFLAACWAGPAASASVFSVCFDYILRVCQSLWDSFLYLGKLYIIIVYRVNLNKLLQIITKLRWSNKDNNN